MTLVAGIQERRRFHFVNLLKAMYLSFPDKWEIMEVPKGMNGLNPITDNITQGLEKTRP